MPKTHLPPSQRFGSQALPPHCGSEVHGGGGQVTPGVPHGAHVPVLALQPNWVVNVSVQSLLVLQRKEDMSAQIPRVESQNCVEVHSALLLQRTLVSQTQFTPSHTTTPLLQVRRTQKRWARLQSAFACCAERPITSSAAAKERFLPFMTIPFNLLLRED